MADHTPGPRGETACTHARTHHPTLRYATLPRPALGSLSRLTDLWQGSPYHHELRLSTFRARRTSKSRMAEIATRGAINEYTILCSLAADRW